MLIPLHRCSRGNGTKESRSSYSSYQEPLKTYKNKVLFLILLGVALLFYAAALTYMK